MVLAMEQDLAGKNYIVTGANSGIGKVTATELARRGARVILACRSAEKAATVVDEIKRTTGNAQVEAVQLDLSDLPSVRRCAEQLLARDMPIHGLVNNAGITAGVFGVRAVTRDGFEPTFATNHLGHYLFTRLLLDRIKQTQGARIVNVASHSHYFVKKFPWHKLHKKPSLTGLGEYNVSKLANVLFTRELARRLAGTGVTVYATHPGQVMTNIWNRFPAPIRKLVTRGFITAEQGAVSTIHAAASPDVAAQSGLYYDQYGKEKRVSRLAQNDDLAKELWTRSAEWTGIPA
jgi:NAD(P)-dependent dehydrogenase (short-subunit alcohol dehydrogenase family)